MYYYMCKNSAMQRGIWANDAKSAAIRFIVWYAIEHAVKPGKLYAVEVKDPGTDTWVKYQGSYVSFYVGPRA